MGIGAVLILLILVSGFICCHEHPLHYYKLHRYDGQYLYLQVAKLGLYSLAFAFILNYIFLFLLSLPIGICGFPTWPDYIHLTANWLVQHQIVSSKESLKISWLLILSTTMILIVPIVNAKVFEKLLKRKHSFNTNEETTLWIMSMLFKDSPLDQLLFDSLTSQEKNLMLTMNDRKVYVGKVTSMGEPNENEGADQEVSLIPILSGFRDKDTLKVNFTTEYHKIDEDFSLILKQENIVSATYFSFDVYEKFQNNNVDPQTSPAQ